MGLPAIAVGAGLAGAGLNAFGTYSNYQMQSQAAAYQAQVYENQAKMEGLNMTQTSAGAQQRAFASDLKYRSLIAGEQAGLASHGVTTGTGSAQQVKIGGKMMAGIDRQTIAMEEAQQVMAEKERQTTAKGEAGLQSYLSSAYSSMAPIAALGAGLSGAASTLGSAAALSLAT